MKRFHEIQTYQYSNKTATNRKRTTRELRIKLSINISSLKPLKGINVSKADAFLPKNLLRETFCWLPASLRDFASYTLYLFLDQTSGNGKSVSDYIESVCRNIYKVLIYI